ncbi:hypothetical protein M407DRAFT_210301 [Tulasnella calospora MUT 4182]|uniref:Uncharacterized protein n=1 Tax=Tulasnella calospora MUT 4182 TaxID=1051891 RepID=A0A0C3QKB3_9AGAM|nr:hypothetical protein M407DRAFT_210301 [Tulasnella calospora MUT 4182]
MERHQKPSDAFSTLFVAPRVRISPILGGIPSRFNTFLVHFDEGARCIRRIFPSLSPLPFREKSNPEWGSENSGIDERNFQILAHYAGWVTTGNKGDHNLQLNTVLNDVQILLDSLKYKHGDTSRRWYFVTDFDAYYNGAQVPRATLSGTDTVVLPTNEGILGILREASREGGSGFVHLVNLTLWTTPGGVHFITPEANEKIRYTQVSDGSPNKEAFIVGTDGVRLYGRDFIECLSEGDEKRRGTLTLSFDMCNATEFLAGIIKLPYQYRSPNFDGGANDPAATTRSTNQLVVISASQRDQFAGEYCRCGALTYLLATALMEESDGQQASTASDIIRYIHGVCETQPNRDYLQTPQIASRYPLTGSFWLLPEYHSVL